jgi:mannitol-1-phosphate 5-dehydrogenase
MVIFGAGNIGRGLLAELLSRDGHPVVFVEALHERAEHLRRASAYKVYLTGAFEDVCAVQGYRVIDSDDTAGVQAAVAEADLAAVSVGPSNLGAVATVLAPALTARVVGGSGTAKADMPLPILVCENKHGADRLLAAALLKEGALVEAFTCIATSIERMVRSAPGSLDLYAEAGASLFVDQSQWEDAGGGDLPVGFDLVDDLDAYYARKLYTNNAGHALIAYMGSRRGCQTIAEGAGDVEIAAALRALLDAAARMLALDYGLDPAEAARHTAELVAIRFANQALADPIRRVARDPVRKLGPEDRLVGLLRRLERHNLPTDGVCRAIAAALHYHDDEDAQSGELSALVNAGGPALALERICKIVPGDPGFETIISYFETEA